MSDWAHQTFGVSEAVRRIEGGETRLCLTSPTGGGKSLMIQRLLEWAVQREWRGAVLTNRKLLTAQLSRGLNANGIHLGVRASEFESWEDSDAPVQVCSVPTEVARVLKGRERAMKRLATEEQAHRDHRLAPAELAIVDEAHMNKADRTIEILNEYREKFNAVIVGVTATPLGIGQIYDSLIVAGKTSELRECGALVKADCFEPAVIDLPKIRRSKQEIFTQKQMDDAVKAVWTQHIVGHIFTHWKGLNPDARPTLGMAPGVKESVGLATEFYQRGVNAAHIDSNGIYVDGEYYRTTKQEDRDEVFEKSKGGEVPVIFNRFVLREAIDLPWLEHLVLCTPIASVLSFVQTVGRVLRASPSTNKARAIVTDHANSIRTHGSPNLDRDRDWMQYFHEDADKLQRDRQDYLRDPERKPPEPITCPECGRMRAKGPTCPQCGYQHTASVRRVIQESGTLVAVTGDVFPRRTIRMKPDTVQLWVKTYHRMKNARNPKSFRQALALFKYENHYDPPRDLPLMPKNPRDFSRKIKAVPYGDLIPYERN